MSATGNILLVARRELKSYVRSPLGYGAAGAVLLIDGLWFMARAIGGAGEKRLSAQVLSEFFYCASGTTVILALVFAMRLIAQEHESGTLVLLKTAPLRDRDVIIGKFLSVLAVLVVISALTAYMPALIFVNGKVSIGHILVGYLGVLLLSASAVAIGLFASALAKTQVVAAILALVVTGVMYLWFIVAKVTSAPVSDFLNGMALHHLRQRDFMLGMLKLENAVFYVAVTFVFLLAATKTLEARRWR